jgi:hypothetical protein
MIDHVVVVVVPLGAASYVLGQVCADQPAKKVIGWNFQGVSCRAPFHRPSADALLTSD